MEILTAPLHIGTHNMGFSSQFPAEKEPGNLTPNMCNLQGYFDAFFINPYFDSSSSPSPDSFVLFSVNSF